MYKRNFTDEFGNTSLAHTLSTQYIGTNGSGWIIEGEIHTDYYEWVNDFTATHSKYGRVWGDFEKIVYADSKEGYEHFTEYHQPSKWDYWDI